MITSTSNEQVRDIRKLRLRKYREESGLAFIEGSRIVLEAIKYNAPIQYLVSTPTFDRSDKRKLIHETIEIQNIKKLFVSDEVFESISGKEGPQGIGAVVRQSWLPFSEFTEGFSGLWVCLWEVADPGNLGTILRTMDAVNARGLLLVGNSTDPYDPGAIRGSMGALFSRILVKSNLDELTRWMVEKSIFAVGTSDAASKYYRDVVYPMDMLLVMGSERQGLPEALKHACSEMVSLPMEGSSDSLNLAVATGVILYEILHQRSKGTGRS